MSRTSQLPPTPKSDLRLLEQEHSEIRRMYVAMDEAILHAHGSPRIIEIAERLVQLLLLHLVHEEQFLEEISGPVLRGQNRNGNDVSDELRRIEDGLRLRDVDAALQLRGFCKRWMSNHLHVETLEYETEEWLAEGNDGDSRTEVRPSAEESPFTWYPQINPHLQHPGEPLG